MTLKQANWIRNWWGKEDHDIYHVATKFIDNNKLDAVDQDTFQEIYDAYNKWDGFDDNIITGVYRKLLAIYKKS